MYKTLTLGHIKIRGVEDIFGVDSSGLVMSLLTMAELVIRFDVLFVMVLLSELILFRSMFHFAEMMLL